MQRLYFDAEVRGGIVQIINQRAIENPIDPKLEDRKACKFIPKRVDAELMMRQFQDEYIQDNNQSRYRTSSRNRAILIMLSDGVWSKELADLNGLTMEDVVQYHSQMHHAREYINNETEQVWITELVRRAEWHEQNENKKIEAYNDGMKGTGEKIIDQLLSSYNFTRANIKPRQLVQNSLNASRERISEALRDLSDSKDNEEQKELKRTLKTLFANNRRHFYELFLDEEGNEAFTYLKAVPEKMYMDQPRFEGVDKLIITSLSHAHSLLKEYVRWFNSVHEEEIEEFKQESKAERNKRRYDNDPEVIRKRAAKEHAINFARELKEQGLSGSQIANELTAMGYKTHKNTVNDWLRKES